MPSLPSDLPDAALVRRARAGGTDAFEALVRRHYRAAWAVALAVTGNAADAEDVCQDAFCAALERLDDCREPDRFAGWLLRIVRNTGHNWRAHQERRAARPLAPEQAGRAPAPSAERADLRARLAAALRTLSDVQRTVVLLHDLEGFTHREIAATVGCSEGMSRQHLFTARRHLRALLDGDAVREYLP